jgi:DNA-binding beta-propeller fold protein YncE
MPYPDDEYMELFTKTDLEPEAHDIAVASDGRIFVTDIMLCRVLVFSDAGDLLGSFGGPGARPGELSWPGCLAISDKDEVHVCNSLNTRIEVFDLAGSFIRSYGQSRSFIGNLVVPLGIAFDKKGRAIVTENRMGALQYFGPSAEDSGLWEYKFHMADEVVELDELSKQRPVTSFYAQGGVAVFPDGETVVFRLQNGELMARRLTETTSNQEDQPDKP